MRIIHRFFTREKCFLKQFKNKPVPKPKWDQYRMPSTMEMFQNPKRMETCVNTGYELPPVLAIMGKHL